MVVIMKSDCNHATDPTVSRGAVSHSNMDNQVESSSTCGHEMAVVLTI